MMQYRIMLGLVLAMLAIAGLVASQPAIAQAFAPSAAPDLASPADRVSLAAIVASGSRLTLNIPNAIIYTIADTNSMDPVLDKGSTVIAVKPRHGAELVAGDIIIYRPEKPDSADSGSRAAPVIHRLAEVGEDSEGWYGIPKGDNNLAADGKVRFGQIEAVVVGILY